MEIFRRCAEMPKCNDGNRRSRWVIVRNTADQLKKTTLKTWFAWFPDGVAGRWRESERTFYLEVGDIKAEILFLPLDTPDDQRRLLSLECTGVFINEAREVHPDLIIAARSRMPRFPSKAQLPVDPATGVPVEYWSGLIMDSNPPSEDSWLYEQFETKKPDGWEIYKQPSGLSPEAENRENLGKTYYEDMCEGAPEDFIRVHVHGEYGRSLVGRPVYEKSFVREYHVAAEELQHLTYGQYPIVVGMDFGRCYDDITEVLTESGWKLFKDVAGTERVASLHPVTREMHYTTINFKTEFDYAGDMLTWSGTNINLCVTPEHRFPFTTRGDPDTLQWASAQEVSAQMAAHRYAVVAPRAWVGVTPTGLPLNMSPVAYARFLGWWMADGSVDAEHDRVTISQTKLAPQLSAVREDLLSCGVVTHGCGAGFRFTNAEIATHLRLFGSKHGGGRRVPNTIMHAPRDVIEAFVMAYTAGDGHIRAPRAGGKSEEHTIWFQSEVLAGQFQDLAQKLGWGSGMRVQKETTSHTRDGRTIRGCQGWVVQFKKQWERVELLPSQFSRAHYAGKIYCLNVPHHTLCVRRQGKVSWNGNTPAAVFLQRNARGQTLVLDSLYVENMGLEKFLREHVKPLCFSRFLGCSFIVVGDPAGWARSQLSELNVADVLKSEGFTARRAPTNDPSKRIAAVEHQLAQQTGGKPAFLIDPRCKHLIQGLYGGYKYRRKQDGSYDTTPMKDEFSHDNDALQYGVLGIDSAGSMLNVAVREVESVDLSAWT